MAQPSMDHAALSMDEHRPVLSGCTIDGRPDLFTEVSKLAVNYCGSSKVKKAAQSVFVLCDSSVAIDVIIQRSGSVNKPDVLELLQSQAKELAKMNVSIYLAWIPGHAGIECNQRADKLAKDMSEDIFKGRVSATSCISMNSALHISAEITYNSWQRKWECDSAGFHTRQLVSRVGTRLLFPDDRDSGVSYCRLLLGDTMLKDEFQNRYQ